jgi:hypothetical protein
MKRTAKFLATALAFAPAGTALAQSPDAPVTVTRNYVPGQTYQTEHGLLSTAILFDVDICSGALFYTDTAIKFKADNPEADVKHAFDFCAKMKRAKEATYILDLAALEKVKAEDKKTAAEYRLRVSTADREYSNSAKTADDWKKLHAAKDTAWATYKAAQIESFNTYKAAQQANFDACEAEVNAQFTDIFRGRVTLKVTLKAPETPKAP